MAALRLRSARLTNCFFSCCSSVALTTCVHAGVRAFCGERTLVGERVENVDTRAMIDTGVKRLLDRRYIQKVLFILSMSISVVGCGSLMTLPRSEQAIKSSMEKHETKCSYMPYVYSGVAYSFCWLHAEIDKGVLSPKNEGVEHPDHNYSDSGILLAADLVLSGAIDTIALPYTIYKQSKDGSINLE